MTKLYVYPTPLQTYKKDWVQLTTLRVSTYEENEHETPVRHSSLGTMLLARSASVAYKYNMFQRTIM